MLRFERSKDENVSLGLHFGGFDIAQVLREIGRAYRAGDLEPGIDSLVAVDPSVAPGDVSLADMTQISACVAAHESGRPDGAFRSVFLAPDPASRIFALVYTATWTIVPHLAPRHAVVSDLAAGEAFLGTFGLADQLADMRPRPGISYLR